MVASQGWEELFSPTIHGLQCFASYPPSESLGRAEILQVGGCSFYYKPSVSLDNADHQKVDFRLVFFFFLSMVNAASVYPLVIAPLFSALRNRVQYSISRIRPIVFTPIFFYLSRVSSEALRGHHHSAHLVAHASVCLKAFKNWYLELITIFLSRFSLLFLFGSHACIMQPKRLRF